MRTEKEMYDLILNFARSDENIRLVVINGSRANPNAKKDIFQDYDAACFVRDVSPYQQREDIPAYFGELMILQIPEEMGSPPPANDGRYGYLMQFMDGTRIDLGFIPLSELPGALHRESLTKVLLDKDELAEGIAPPSEASFIPTPPTQKQFDDCCNEFWWLNPYVAKGLWRGELINPRYFLEAHMRPELHKMLTWAFGIRTGFERSPGKLGKHFQEVFGEEVWQRYQVTCPSAQPGQVWNALFEMGVLFRQTAAEVSAHFSFAYPQREDDEISAFIRRVRRLPSAGDRDLRDES
jgi:aminoglycoside 6-adenylyltransferase